jgi:hypothetical protein
LIAWGAAIWAPKERSIPWARFKEQCSEEEIEALGKIQGVHGGSLVDFGSALMQKSFAPQCGQI